MKAVIHGSTADALSMPGKRNQRDQRHPFWLRLLQASRKPFAACAASFTACAFFDEESVGTAIRQHGGSLR